MGPQQLIKINILAAAWQNQQNYQCASEDSDQPGHPPKLFRVFAVRMKIPWVPSYPLSAQRRLWSDSANDKATPSLRWAHKLFCRFCHAAAHITKQYQQPIPTRVRRFVYGWYLSFVTAPIWRICFECWEAKICHISISNIAFIIYNECKAGCVVSSWINCTKCDNLVNKNFKTMAPE